MENPCRRSPQTRRQVYVARVISVFFFVLTNEPRVDACRVCAICLP